MRNTNTSSAVRANILRGQRRIAERLRAAGWTVLEPDPGSTDAPGVGRNQRIPDPDPEDLDPIVYVTDGEIPE